MSIWLDQLEREAKQEALSTLRDRQALRSTLAQQHAGGAALLLLDALPRGEAAASADPAEGQELLRTGLARLGCETFALRRGQSGLVLEAEGERDRLRPLVAGLHQYLKQAGRRRFKLVFGAARAREARLGAASWLALADLRLQVCIARAGLGAEPGDAAARAVERRRTGKR